MKQLRPPNGTTKYGDGEDVYQLLEVTNHIDIGHARFRTRIKHLRTASVLLGVGPGFVGRYRSDDDRIAVIYGWNDRIKFWSWDLEETVQRRAEALPYEAEDLNTLPGPWS